ncbi:hypothetical protein ALI144C_25715 [Actinosynnema sp. ALI-1.44]|uniref:Calx-beta domain-containing protein n=1 Tax=Actinosynnema sp. ALI-1.44 TaxID=1933779 RepID=UPI00097BECBA|nr:Calx-beta domain-containing protein [Actinosynnema sp. ALI-1.44]ONI79549.1 hypothetical protein ALI144C_25715 [Actinosynnema sp. ALI-1.44]
MPTRTLALMVASAVLLAGLPSYAAPAQVDPPSVDLTLGPGGSATLTKKVTTPTIPPNPDIVLLGDTTGSMIDVLANVAANAEAIAGQVMDTQPTAKFAVAQYKHHNDGALAFSVNQALTGSQEAVHAGTQKWVDQAEGGGIPASDFVNALYQIASGAIAFRPDSSRIVAWFGDSHSEDPSIGHTMGQAIAALKAKDIRVIAVPIAGTDGGGLDSLGQASAITSQTGGVMMPGTSPGAVAQAILDGLENLDATVTHQQVGCAPQLTTSLSPASKTVPSGQAVEFTETIGVKEGTKPGTYSCKVKFLVNGAQHDLVQTITVRVPGIVVRDVVTREGKIVKLPVQLDRASTTPITVHYKTVDGTATAGTDYKAAEDDLTFTPGQTSKTVHLQILSDKEYKEGNETFSVQFTQGATVVGTAKVTIKERHSGSCGATAVKLLNQDVVAANSGEHGCDTDSKTAAGTKVGAGPVSVQVSAVSAKTGKAAASTSVGSVKITVLGQVVEIGVIESHASASCDTGKPVARSTVGSLKVNGSEVDVGSGPVTVPLVAGKLKLNSTTRTADSVTQRAVVLDTALTDLVIGEARAGCAK